MDFKFKFSNPEVDEQYESVFGKDKTITIQLVYWGKLSNITPEVAEKLIAMGDNQIRRKTPPPVFAKDIFLASE